ncbi:translation initiation factor IF-2-like [Manacus candei]|uniref:translation initiation factor IF-2-like n=1 Tax=Manacus candei TaxID=415023 RepID=UPI0022263A0A|nr:translation initiation factor IF-2-like [Manacus candei]
MFPAQGRGAVWGQSLRTSWEKQPRGQSRPWSLPAPLEGASAPPVPAPPAKAADQSLGSGGKPTVQQRPVPTPGQCPAWKTPGMGRQVPCSPFFAWGSDPRAHQIVPAPPEPARKHFPRPRGSFPGCCCSPCAGGSGAGEEREGGTRNGVTSAAAGGGWGGCRGEAAREPPQRDPGTRTPRGAPGMSGCPRNVGVPVECRGAHGMSGCPRNVGVPPGCAFQPRAVSQEELGSHRDIPAAPAPGGKIPGAIPACGCAGLTKWPRPGAGNARTGSISRECQDRIHQQGMPGTGSMSRECQDRIHQQGMPGTGSMSRECQGQDP